MASGAADLLWQLWNSGEVIDGLPADLKPRSRTKGYEIQAELAA